MYAKVKNKGLKIKWLASCVNRSQNKWANKTKIEISRGKSIANSLEI